MNLPVDLRNDRINISAVSRRSRGHWLTLEVRFMYPAISLSNWYRRDIADGLNVRAVAAGKLYFGSATDNGELSDSAYVAGLSNTNDFGQITPGNSQKA